MTDLDDRLRAIAEQHTQQLVAAIGDAYRSHILGMPPALLSRRRSSQSTITRDMACIAAGCKNGSRGPRYRYLCPKHEDASEKQVGKWRELRRRAKPNGAKRAVR